MKIITAPCAVIGIVFGFSAAAHDGPRDSYGCHPNIAHGTYHCHSGPLAQRQFRNKEAMLRALREETRRERDRQKLVPSGYLK